ncbi:MAG: hypothetical protein WA825_12615, partial [Steroidobacteraceae bacterium]
AEAAPPRGVPAASKVAAPARSTSFEAPPANDSDTAKPEAAPWNPPPVSPGRVAPVAADDGAPGL